MRAGGKEQAATHGQDVHMASSGVCCSGIQSGSYAAGTAAL